VLKDHLTYAIPLIRTIGNLSSGSDHLILPFLEHVNFLPLILFYIQSDSRPVKKESLWMLSNITGGSDEYVRLVLAREDVAPLLVGILKTANYDVRKEAAYSVMNMVTRGKDVFDMFPVVTLLPREYSYFILPSH
jgi:hypothetical protein